MILGSFKLCPFFNHPQPLFSCLMCFCHSRKLLLFISQLICCRLNYAEIAVVVVETVNEIKNTHMYISCCHITNYIKNVFLSASSLSLFLFLFLCCVSRQLYKALQLLSRHIRRVYIVSILLHVFNFCHNFLLFFRMVKNLTGFIAQHLRWLIFIASHTFAFPTLNH